MKKLETWAYGSQSQERVTMVIYRTTDFGMDVVLTIAESQKLRRALKEAEKAARGG